MSYTKKQDFEAVVFDMDGILFDTEHVLLECWQQLAGQYGISDVEKPYRESVGTNRRQTEEIFYAFYGPDFPYDTYKEMANKLYWEACQPGYPRMKPGVFELLNALKEAQVPLALASSTSRPIVLKELEAAGLIDYFSFIICGDMVVRSKPDPEIYRKACEGLQTPCGSCYAIEDSYHGIHSACDAGMRAIMVPDMLPETLEMAQLAEAVLPSLLEVRDYLLEQID